jgi:hypothetical protein
VDAATPPSTPAYVYAATDFGPRSPEERDLCNTADHPDWLYLGGLVALNAASAYLDSRVLKYEGGSSGIRLVGAGAAGLTWGAFITGAYLALPKCESNWVSGHPPEGVVRSSLPFTIALSTLAVATAPFFVFIETGPIPTHWPLSERSARVVIPMVTGLVGSLLPYLEFLAPKTFRAALKLERIRLQGAPVVPGASNAPTGFVFGYAARF